MAFSRCGRDQSKLVIQTSIVLTLFRLSCTPSKLASHALGNARTTSCSHSSLTCSSTPLSKEEERQAETSHCPSKKPSNKPPLACTRASLFSYHPAVRASSVSRFGPSRVRMFETLLDLRHSSAAWASAASTWDWAEVCVATNNHSARRRRLVCCLRARKVERMSEREEKHHRQWASTVVSKTLPLLARGDETKEGKGREKR